MTRKVRPPARGSAPVHPGRGNSKVVRNLRGLAGLLMAGTVALLQGLGSVVLWTSQVTVSGARRLRWPFGTLTTWTMLSGFLAGFQLLACRQYWLGWMGSSLPISLGVTVACLLAFGVSQRRWMRNIGDRFTASDRFAVAQFALAGWVIALPVIAMLAGFLARAAGNAILDS
ncbi:MAG TPA: hypothetical protein VHB77_12315, partial [Planctomycetaceae bacterium]|nr:hypothetical protein [Planctomycetaceae bacterium]